MTLNIFLLNRLHPKLFGISQLRPELPFDSISHIIIIYTVQPNIAFNHFLFGLPSFLLRLFSLSYSVRFFFPRDMAPNNLDQFSPISTTIKATPTCYLVTCMWIWIWCLIFKNKQLQHKTNKKTKRIIII